MALYYKVSKTSFKQSLRKRRKTTSKDFGKSTNMSVISFKIIIVTKSENNSHHRWHWTEIHSSVDIWLGHWLQSTDPVLPANTKKSFHVLPKSNWCAKTKNKPKKPTQIFRIKWNINKFHIQPFLLILLKKIFFFVCLLVTSSPEAAITSCSFCLGCFWPGLCFDKENSSTVTSQLID